MKLIEKEIEILEILDENSCVDLEIIVKMVGIFVNEV